MPFHFNYIILPLFVPVIIAAKSFLDHQDLKLAFAELVSKRTIIFTILALIFSFILQITMNKSII